MKVRDVEFVKSAAKLEQVPREDLPEIAFLGPSNVGKSSLINALLGSKKQAARVSRTPGRTQLLNFFKVNKELYFVDLPGYGFAKAPKAVQKSFLGMIEGYLAGSTRLALLYLLFDCRRTPSVRDLELRKWLEDNDVPFAVVLTKGDKLSKSALAKQARVVEKALGFTESGTKVLTFSSKTGAGRTELWSVIAEACAAD